MGKASSGKKVARAARAGRGASRRPQRSYGFPIMILLIAIVGLLLVVVSRQDRVSSADEERPRNFVEFPEDHWHVAFGVYVCDSYRPNLGELVNSGIHTHGDGLIHVEARNSAEMGRNATIGKFASDYGNGLTIRDDELKIPGDEKEYQDGGKCGDDEANVRYLVWSSPDDDEPREVRTDPRDIRLRDKELVAFVFAPDDAEIPKPPSRSALADPNAAEGGGTATSVVTDETTTETSAPGTTSAETATSAPESTEPPTTGATATSAP